MKRPVAQAYMCTSLWYGSSCTGYSSGSLSARQDKRAAPLLAAERVRRAQHRATPALVPQPLTPWAPASRRAFTRRRVHKVFWTQGAKSPKSLLHHPNPILHRCKSFFHQRKTKGQQLKGKIVSALFHTFWQFSTHIFTHFFRVFQNFSSTTFS